VRTLELQALAPIENPLEMDLPLPEAEQRLREHPDYPALFRQAYGREPDLFGLTRALAAYQRSLISARSPYDRYLLGDSSALDADQKAGKEIFFSERAECFHCHTGVLFSDFSFQNNGLYEVYTDSGRAVITGNPRDVGRFKVPSLRNVALTAPYMHDGSLPTLESVIDHYMSGGKRHRNKSHFLRPFDLNETEKRQLIAFLHSLTDSEFITDPRHRP
jgi:cytochrome c peroxidase